MRLTVRRAAILPTAEARAVMQIEGASLAGVCTFVPSASDNAGNIVDGYRLEGFGSATMIFLPSMKGLTHSKVQIVSETKNEALVLARKAKEVGLLKFDAFPAVISAINDAVETGNRGGLKLNLPLRLIQTLDKIRETTGESRTAIIIRFIEQGVERTYRHED